MNRRKFLERLGIGTAVAVSAPLVIAEAMKGDISVDVLDIEVHNPEQVNYINGNNIGWVKHGDNYLWYNKTDIYQMERLLLEHGNQSLSEFLSKTGNTI